MVRSLKVRRRSAAILGLGAVLLGLNAGCVVRRYTLRTEPPGALAIVNDEEIGPTPVSRSFTYYGDREITFLLDGYETKTVIQPVAAPWWDNLFTEFFSENLVPFTLRDEREFKFDLQQATPPQANDLYNRAEALRAESQIAPKPRRKGFFAWLGFE
ncbi:PEGA domain-containing protein [Paludisphaera borealis]|uniref:PEGA domain-containing protein n=1 Tax=Paludisphaera borealis TaxID=1387353 RepID=A0A1U7CKJ3_9BACT|nr:PEGA domain-containing protein [Paludisphaera borealis]APW59426.1 hypothetical protein BSF38_00849 [Paludisphaera borealis]